MNLASDEGSRDASPQAGRAATGSVDVVACGALAGHIRDIAARRGWPVTVHPLPARLHNRPGQIPLHTERAVATVPPAPGSRTVLAYADCGTYGQLDDLAERAGTPRLPGLHCYDLYAGADTVRGLFHMEPGTYLLTDYLVRTFDRTVLASLGLDRHPELWPDYFAHYTRVVWLAQQPTPELEAEAERIAGLFGLPLTTITTGLSRLEAALAKLLFPGGRPPVDPRQRGETPLSPPSPGEPAQTAGPRDLPPTGLGTNPSVAPSFTPPHLPGWGRPPTDFSKESE